MPEVISKCFRVKDTVIPVTIFPNGTVSVGSTGAISIEDYTNLGLAIFNFSNAACRNKQDSGGVIAS